MGLDSLAQVVKEDGRWEWGGAEGRSRAGAGIFTAGQQDILQQNGTVNGTEQFVYNINGITWLCKKVIPFILYPITIRE